MMTNKLSEKLPSKVRSRIGLMVVVGILLAAGWLLMQRDAVEPEVVPLEPVQVVRIGLSMQPSNALTMIALANGYFQQLGIEPVVKKYPSGKRALIDGLYAGEVDITASSDVPVAMAGLEGRDIRILATSFKADNVNSVVARRDCCIEESADLKGKKIATQRSSAVHFFLSLYLLEHGLKEEDVLLSYMKAEQLPLALARGDIDAFSMREPYISQASEMLDGNVVVLSEPGLYQQVELILIRSSLQEKSTDLIDRYLRALLKAETFAASQPKKAIGITAEYLGVEQESIAEIWPTFKLRVELGQATLLLLEREARWAINNKMTSASKVPNYMGMVAPEFLYSIKPAAVSVIRE